MIARFLLQIRAWDSKSSVQSENTTSVVGSEGDPAFARQSTLMTIGRSVVSDFGDDPVLSARSYASSTTQDSLGGYNSTRRADDEEHSIGL
jgi:hypothetical protein